MSLEIIQSCRPHAPVGHEPRVDSLQWFWPNAVQAPLRVAAHLDQARFAQDAQVLGNRRLTQRQVVDELSDRALRLSEQIQNATAIGLGDDFEDGHDLG
jgi:hypothetical protein